MDGGNHLVVEIFLVRQSDVIQHSLLEIVQLGLMLKLQQQIADSAEALAMMRSDPVRREPSHVLTRSVAGVVFPNIVRVVFAQSRHEQIARHFGEDRRTSDAEAPCIPVYYRGVRNWKRAHRSPVDYDVVGRHLQATQCALHCEHARLVDVDSIYLPHRSGSKRKCNRALANLCREPYALIMGQPLGVIHSRYRTSLSWHYHCAGDNRSRDWASAYFVDSGQERTFFSAEVALNGCPTCPAKLATLLVRSRTGRVWGRVGSSLFDLVLHGALRSLS